MRKVPTGIAAVKRQKNVGLLRNGAGALVTKDTEKAEALNAFFTSAFTAKMVL